VNHMRVILFDIDGTLAATTNADNGCYERAFETAFGFPLPTTDWHRYQHVTDFGIIHEAFEWADKSKPSKADLDRFELSYERELRDSCERSPNGFAEVPGARQLVEELCARSDISVALATGGMRRTALFKLSQIGIDGMSMHGAFANDAISRCDIARVAIERTGVTPSDVVYVGDGAWDAATSAALGMRFIGICREYAYERLVAAGATVILEHFADKSAFYKAIESATVPIPPVGAQVSNSF